MKHIKHESQFTDGDVVIARYRHKPYTVVYKIEDTKEGRSFVSMYRNSSSRVWKESDFQFAYERIDNDYDHYVVANMYDLGKAGCLELVEVLIALNDWDELQ